MNRKEFERVSPESVGISSEAVLRFVEALENDNIDMHGLMIMRYGKVLAEGWWAPYAPGMHHMCASLTKTYMGTAIGIALQEGLLSLDDKLTDLFPEYMPENPSEYIDELTVRSVLTMGTGMTEFPSMEGNWAANYIAMPLVYRPGTHFAYNSVGSTFLGKIILKLTGKHVYDYLAEKLFSKIGIDYNNLDYGVAPEGQDMWAWRTISTTEDNLRLMKLYADGGVWEGERILPEEYVKLASSKQIDNRPDNAKDEPPQDNSSGYGFQIWMCKYPGAYRADGAAGQYSVVIPDKEMIVSINENARNPFLTLSHIWDILIPAAGDTPLSESEQSYTKLQRKLKHLAIEAPAYSPYAEALQYASGKYTVMSGDFHPYCTGMFAPEANPVRRIEIRFDTMEGSLYWQSKDRTDVKIGFAMDGSRRYNRFASPWQFATICYANGFWATENTLVLELLWPENNSKKTLTFRFTQDTVTVSETKGGLPGQPVVTSETVLKKEN